MVSFNSLGLSFQVGEVISGEKLLRIKERVPFLSQRGYIKSIKLAKTKTEASGSRRRKSKEIKK